MVPRQARPEMVTDGSSGSDPASMPSDRRYYSEV